MLVCGTRLQNSTPRLRKTLIFEYAAPQK